MTRMTGKFEGYPLNSKFLLPMSTLWSFSLHDELFSRCIVVENDKDSKLLFFKLFFNTGKYLALGPKLWPLFVSTDSRFRDTKLLNTENALNDLRLTLNTQRDLAYTKYHRGPTCTRFYSTASRFLDTRMSEIGKTPMIAK